MNVTIVDYNSGNISSVINSFKEAAKDKVKIEVTSNLNKIKSSDKLVLPGQGSFKSCVDEQSQKEFLKGAKIAYETIITDFSDSDNKLIASKPLLSKKIFDQFKEALEERERRGQFAEITFIGIKSALVKSYKKVENSFEVTVDFVSEIITCVKDKEKKIISGDSEKIKTVYDTWVFSRDLKSNNPNWLLIDTLT